MKPYQWMMDFTPQKEWIEGKGLILSMAFFFTEIGASLYLVSLLLEYPLGCIIGLALCALLGGGLHLLYLGKPYRSWRAIMQPKKSELSRGLIIMFLFIFIGVLQLAPNLEVFSYFPWESNIFIFKILQSIIGFFVITHGFMMLSIMSSIPFWNAAILPMQSLASGIWVGTQLLMFFFISTPMSGTMINLEIAARWSLFAYLILTIMFFWNAKHGAPAAQKSLKTLIYGDLSLQFYLGVIVIDFFIPIMITIYFYASQKYIVYFLVIRTVCAFLGDINLRYLIFKAARYTPLINSNIISGAHSA